MDTKVELLIDQAISARILLVDDESLTRTIHRALLATHFDVLTAASGAEALQLCERAPPDLVLLDINMPGLDGIETCRRLRKFSGVPVIFLTGEESLHEHLRAYEAGGCDVILKPAKAEFLVRKVTSAIRREREARDLMGEKDRLQLLAMSFLSSLGENGVLLKFLRESLDCRSFASLARNVFACASELGAECLVRLRHGADSTVVTPHGAPTDLELSIFERAASMGKMFQFKRNLVVNCAHVSIMVNHMPDETETPERAGSLRDNLAILAETADRLCEIVAIRIESTQRAESMQLALGRGVAAVESLRAKYLSMLVDTRLLLQNMIDNVNKRLGWLGATGAEEEQITNELDNSVQALLALLCEGGSFESAFETVLDALRSGDNSAAVELF